ncbi:glycosyltransferase [Paucihalobacter sp.]|uniref:glycosyltransferase n=1 Tax=Paucihalobacter sp. TaxID=2850405 RepID=UPI002FE4020D
MEISKIPLVSVIVPTYNRPEYLELTLRSISEQTYKNIEIIVVDDGTEGNQNDLICKKYKNLLYKKIQNSGGPAKPRNIGIKLSKGKYLAFVDDDDLWIPTKIEEQVDILEKNKDFDLVHSYCAIIDKDGIVQDKVVGRPGSPDTKHGDVKLKMMGNWTIMMPTPLIRKELVNKVGLFNEEIEPTYADVEFFTRNSFYTKFYYIDKPLVFYRKHEENMSSDLSIYKSLPFVLLKLLKSLYDLNIISKHEFFKLRQNLCQMRLKMLRYDFWGVLLDLFKINYFWFLNINNVKLLTKKILNL